MQQQQYHHQQGDLRENMPPFMHTSYDSSITNNDYSYPLEHQQSNSVLLYSPSSAHMSQSEVTHHYNDQDQYPSYQDFAAIVQGYLQNLSSKKRDKALIDQARYATILQVLKDPRNTSVSTAQFRFWVKKMFQLTSRQMVCHDGKPVAMREQIYGILVRAHREAHHGGRDKTSALVRRRYSWIPKELIARFVRHCPFCISRRNGNQQSPLSVGLFLPTTPPTYSMVSTSNAMSATTESRQRALSMITSSSSASSNASYPEEMVMMAAAAAAAPQQQDRHQQQSISHFGTAAAALDMSWQASISESQQQSYYAAEAAAAVSVTDTSVIFDHHLEYYPNNSTREQPYNMYSTASSHYPLDIQQESQQLMTMQPALSVYYAQEYELKQNTAYSLNDSANNMTFVPPCSSSRNQLCSASNNTTADTGTAATTMTTMATTTPIVHSQCAGSPSLSHSSSSTSANSSPVHPVYHETTGSSKYFQHQQASNALFSASASTLSLLSHHQSLFEG